MNKQSGRLKTGFQTAFILKVFRRRLRLSEDLKQWRKRQTTRACVPHTPYTSVLKFVSPVGRVSGAATHAFCGDAGYGLLHQLKNLYHLQVATVFFTPSGKNTVATWATLASTLFHLCSILAESHFPNSSFHHQKYGLLFSYHHNFAGLLQL